LNEDICPNCGTALAGPFCAVCGQNRKSYVRGAWQIAWDIVKEVLEFDSRLARTLVALFFKPGYLSQEFSRNRRASYVPPARLYLILSVIFFAVLALTSRFGILGLEQQGGGGEARIDISSDPGAAELFADLTEAQRERLRAALAHSPNAGGELPAQLHAPESMTGDAPEAATVPTWRRALQDWVIGLIEDPGRAYSEFIANLPIAMFCVLPLYALWLKLLYWRRFYAEHLVFALHLHAYLFGIGTLILLLPDTVPTGTSPVLEVIYGPGVFLNGMLKVVGATYYLFALHRMYAASWMATAAKFAAANLGHSILLILAAGATALAPILLP
jgi:hypothetical protein